MQQLQQQRLPLPAQQCAAPHCALQQPARQQLTTRRRALSGIPDAELPPYALLSTPVYSLSSRSAAGAPTLNMITYASPIALRPQRKYALGLYVESQTYANIKETRRAVLQILTKRHASLFHLLGKTSGRDVDKVAELRKLGFAVQEEWGLPVLSDAAGIMELQVVSDFIPGGDHEVVLCDVVAWKHMDDAAAGVGAGIVVAAEPSSSSSSSSSGSGLVQPASMPLYTGFLRQEGYL